MNFQVRSLARRTGWLLAAATVMCVGVSVGWAQGAPELPQASPKARVEQRVGVTDLRLDYSSPGVKKRKIWGELVPYDKVWRTGANAATKLEVTRDFTFAGKPVKAGAYSLWTIPTKGDWTVILNSAADTSGARGHDEKNDVLRVTVKPSKLGASRERLAFFFVDSTDDRTNLDLEWEKVRVRVPIQVDTAAHVTAGIEAALKEAWRPHFAAARYLLDSNGDLARAMGLIDKSISIEATWWNNWVRAQLLGKQGKKSEATAAAQSAQKLGVGDPVYEGFFKDPIAKAIAGWK